MVLERYLLYVNALGGNFLLFRDYYDRRFIKWKFQSYRGKQKALAEVCLIFHSRSPEVSRKGTRRVGRIGLIGTMSTDPKGMLIIFMHIL